jgi:hypothetical protein
MVLAPAPDHNAGHDRGDVTETMLATQVVTADTPQTGDGGSPRVHVQWRRSSPSRVSLYTWQIASATIQTRRRRTRS